MKRRIFLGLLFGFLTASAAWAMPLATLRNDYSLTAPAGWRILGADQDSDFSWGSSGSGLIRVGLVGRKDVQATAKAQAAAQLETAGIPGSPTEYQVGGFLCARISYTANGQKSEEIFCNYRDGVAHRELRCHFEAATRDAPQDAPAFKDVVKSLRWNSRLVSEP